MASPNPIELSVDTTFSNTTYVDLIEPTVADNDQPSVDVIVHQECCLVQIYPVNITEGLSPIRAESLAIGRDTSNQLVLGDNSVSRNHARLEKTEQGFRIVDLKSTNGTFVNDERVEAKDLQGGEVIRFGRFLFKYLSTADESEYHMTVYNAMTRDGLTGAFNKNYMLDSLERELAHARRSRRPLSILLMDIDYFKKINDNYGYLAGDEVLREFCNRLADRLRVDDLLFRYGGEEFAVILAETGIDKAVEVANAFRHLIQNAPMQTSLGLFNVTMSVGVAEFSKCNLDITPTQLINLADEQLYRSKREGRNRVSA